MNLLHDNVILELPEHTDTKFRQHRSGLTLSFALSDKEQYAPVCGIVLEKSRFASVEIGEKVYFHYLSYINAQNTREQLKNGMYDSCKTTWCEGEKHYLLMPAIELICVERGGELFALNDYVLLKSIPKDLKEIQVQDHLGQKSKIFISAKQEGAIEILDVKEKYRTDIAEVLCGGGLAKGAVVYLMPDWDIPLERDILDDRVEPVYYVNKEIVLGCSTA